MENHYAHLRLGSIRGLVAASLLALVVFTGFNLAAPIGAPARDACTEQPRFQPVTIGVPANGIVIFGIQDLLGSPANIDSCSGMDAIDAVLTSTDPAQGAVNVRSANAAPSWSAGTSGFSSPNWFEFAPERGFSGVSRGWEFAIVGGSGSGHLACAHDACGLESRKGIRLGTVAVSFEVRNSPPVAADDILTVSANVTSVVVPARQGLLANDSDANGDPLIVTSEGVTRFPWGTVEINRDGSYQVLVTGEHVTGTHQVRYVIWDQVGSTASADYGLLTITFAEQAPGSTASLHERSARILTAPSAPGQP